MSLYYCENNYSLPFLLWELMIIYLWCKMCCLDKGYLVMRFSKVERSLFLMVETRSLTTFSFARYDQTTGCHIDQLEVNLINLCINPWMLHMEFMFLGYFLFSGNSWISAWKFEEALVLPIIKNQVKRMLISKVTNDES